jgi:hypothetical protein
MNRIRIALVTLLLASPAVFAVGSVQGHAAPASHGTAHVVADPPEDWGPTLA